MTLRVIKEIIVHCSDTMPGQDFRAKDIDAWHRERGWNGNGYHYVVDLDGTVEKGRPISKVGAHVKGHNAHSIGICYIGGRGLDGKAKDTRTPPQKAALTKLIYQLIQKYRCPVHGHHYYDRGKECPCFDAGKEYNGIYERLVFGDCTGSNHDK